jgi:hypothetical protein
LSTTSGWGERTTYRGLRAAANVKAIAVCASLVACGKAEPARTAPLDAGQWIWTAADSARFAEASRTISRLAPTVWIGSVRGSRDGRVTTQLAQSPRLAGTSRVGVVIRFEDDFTAVWDQQPDSAIAEDVARALGALLAAAGTSGVEISEVQVDYDCPERLLERWSTVVSRITRDVPAGREVWLTSLVAHVRHREYGDLFRDRVAGHILQVFDTGDRMSLSNADQIERLASRHRMPFRLGVGAFERTLANGNSTDHRAWFAAARVMSRSEWYRGMWVFPAGRPWTHLVRVAP